MLINLESLRWKSTHALLLLAEVARRPLLHSARVEALASARVAELRVRVELRADVQAGSAYVQKPAACMSTLS